MKPFRSLLLPFLAVSLPIFANAADAPAKPNKPIWGVYIGNNVADLDKYDQWLGKPADAVLVYTGDKDWKDYEGSVGWGMGIFSKAERPALYSVALIPKGATLKEAATGAYNDHWKRVAEKLAKFRPDDPIMYVRTGWEFNGGWFHYKAVGQAENFIGAWKQFVTTFRSVSPRFKFDWCPASGNYMPMEAEEAYPGDEFVDVIGLDVYDQVKWSKIKDPVKRWNQVILNGKHGLVWHRDFAKKHNKPMAYSEWGACGNDVGDETYFIEQMHKWMTENPVLYASYWDSNANYKGKLSNMQYPKAATRYRELFGDPAKGVNPPPPVAATPAAAATATPAATPAAKKN